jgi:hypothetical protein
MAQAFAAGGTRLYYEDKGAVFMWTGSGIPTLIDTLDTEGTYSFEPFGTWLIATDNVDEVKVWKNDGAGFIDIGEGEFSRGKIIKKFGPRLLVYNTDILPAGVHYSKPSDVETWIPSTTDGSGNLAFRDLDSDIVAVEEIAGSHAVYTESKMLVLQYLGEGLRFGIPTHALQGIGAAGKDSVVSLGNRNIGLFRGGVFITDGTSFEFKDNPAINEWIQEEIDWSRQAEIVGFYDERVATVIWSVPLHGGAKIGLSLNMSGEFSFVDASFTSAIQRNVFDTGFVAENGGIFKTSVNGTTLGTMTATTQLIDAGTQRQYKAWDFAVFEGELSGQVRFGFTDTPHNDAIEWNAWQDLEFRVPFTPRESIYMAVDFTSEENVKLTGMTIYGAMAGLVP